MCGRLVLTAQLTHMHSALYRLAWQKIIVHSRRRRECHLHRRYLSSTSYTDWLALRTVLPFKQVKLHRLGLGPGRLVLVLEALAVTDIVDDAVIPLRDWICATSPGRSF